MGNRKIEMYAYKTIIYRMREGQSDRQIAKEGLAGRKKICEVRAMALRNGWLSTDAALPQEEELTVFFEKCKKTQQSNLSSPYADKIEKWAKQGIQATVIFDYLVHQYAFSGSYNSIQRFVKKIKATTPPDLTVPLHFKVAEAAQVDFGQGPILFDRRVNKEVKTWFFIMTLCWSRHQYAELVSHQDIETWLKCHENAFNWFGGVVSKIIIDNPKCAITKACYNDPQVQRSYEAFAQEYRFLISACPPREPKKKGRVEAGVKYAKKNFLPLKRFKDLQDANSQLKQWVMGTAGNRTHGSTFAKPLSQFTQIEQPLLKPLPPSLPEIAVWQKVTLYRDCHVRYQKCKYSAPHQLYGEELWLKSTPTMVAIYHQYQLKAMHSRAFVPGECRTKDEHLPPNARFYLKHDPKWCLEESKKIGEHCCFVVESLLTDPVRDLLRQAQSVLKLSKTYGHVRLEKACQRAVSFNAPNYKTIETILRKGIDNEDIPQETSFNRLGSVYQGEAIYQRYITNIIH